MASLGFHVAHLAGSTDRLFTYARGLGLSGAQREALEREARLEASRPSKEELVEGWRNAVEKALQLLADTPESTLTEPRLVGKARLPSTVLGVLFHAAEHASRHTGQVATTAKLVRGQI